MNDNALVLSDKQSFKGLLDKSKVAIAKVAVPGVEVERLCSLVWSVVTDSDQLKKALTSKEGRSSVISCTQVLASLGLEPTGRYGGAYLVAFNTKIKVEGEADRWETLVQVMPDWRVWRDKAIASGLCSDIIPRPVHRNDEFSMGMDMATGREVVVHKFDPWADDGSRGERIGWLVTMVTDSGPLYECIRSVDIAKRRANAKTDSVWNSWPTEMERKTAIRMAVDARLPLGARKLADLMRLDDDSTAVGTFDVTVHDVEPADPAPVVDLFGGQRQLVAPADLDVDELISWASDQVGPDAAEAILTAHREANGGDVIYDDFTDEVLAAVGGA